MLEILELFALIQQCAPAVHPKTMMAVVQTESGGNPLAINLNGKDKAKPKQPRSVAEAVELVRQLQAEGANFDVGLAQINSRNFSSLGLTPESVFDPCVNLNAGGKVLQDAYESAQKHSENEQVALQSALSVYNTGNEEKGLKNGYVAKVNATAKKYVVPALEVEPKDQAVVLQKASTPAKPEWDVFAGNNSGVMVFK